MLLQQIDEIELMMYEELDIVKEGQTRVMLCVDRFKTNRVQTQQNKVSCVTMFSVKFNQLLFQICQVKKKL